MNLAEQLIEKVGKERKWVVIIGDAMTDHWAHGRVEACQDGCSKFVTGLTRESPGGAANAASCLQYWSVNKSLHTYPDYLWPTKHRLVTADGKIAYRWDDEPPVTEADRANHQWTYNVARAMEMVNHADAVLLSDYDKGFLTDILIMMVVDVCQRRGIPCVADCKRETEVYDGCILKGNREWLSKHAEHGDFNVPGFVMTNGSTPPTVWDRCLVQDASSMYQLQAVKCVNHVGAGDCFAAHLTLALAYGFSLKGSAEIAHSAGRVYVQHTHNRPPRPDEVAADMALGSPTMARAASAT